MRRLANYSRSLLHELRARHDLEYEQTQGYLQLFRHARDLERSAAAREMLIQAGVAHRLLTAEECRRLEPAIDSEPPLAGGLFLPEDETGNCAFFARKLKEICVTDGVRFRFGAAVRSLVTAGDRVESLRLSGGSGAGLSADAFVMAAGVESRALLKAARLPLPIFPVKGYSATAVITHGELAPRIAVMDETHKVAITRMGNRLRIAGTAEIGTRRLNLREAALRTLMKVASDWFPHAANYTQAQYWVGARPMLPDGPPVLGATPYANLFLNVGHGSSGWAMACGSARIVADAILQRPSDIDLDGLTINRYRRYR
jgi:D-amino-acid dehydrogenase